MKTDLFWLELDLVLEVVGPMGWTVDVEVVELSFVAVQFVGLVVGSKVVQEVVLGSVTEVGVDAQVVDLLMDLAVDLMIDLVFDLGAVLELDLAFDLMVDLVVDLMGDLVVDLGVVLEFELVRDLSVALVVDLVVELVDCVDCVESVLMVQQNLERANRR